VNTAPGVKVGVCRPVRVRSMPPGVIGLVRRRQRLILPTISAWFRAELKSRMNDLQSQLDKLQRLIELKNGQLAKMQAAGAAVPPVAATQAAPDATAPANAAV
ncbi:hypothetical protein A244_27400, partial [Pseudomonas syringae pv. actinidiae ICMP 18807]